MRSRFFLTALPHQPVRLAIACVAALLSMALPRAEASINFTEFRTFVPGGSFIVSGPDSSLWFTAGNSVGKVTTAGVATTFAVPNSSPLPSSIVSGPDGNLWFTEVDSNKIASITTTGILAEFPIPTPNSTPLGITVGPNGSLWFAEYQGNKVGEITLDGSFTEFPVPTPNCGPRIITPGPDGNLWFSEFLASKIGRITPAGVITEFTIPTANSGDHDIHLGSDGNLWFTEYSANQIGRITPAGVITEYPTHGTTPWGITSGPDGNIWFTELFAARIGRITPAGVITEFSLPSSARPHGITAGPDGNLWWSGDDSFSGTYSGVAGRVALTVDNDNFAAAQLLTGASGSVSGSNIGATREPGEPNHAGNPGGASVWYRWTAPANGAAAFTTAGSSFDTLLAAYTGSSLADLVEAASNDDDPAGGLTSKIKFATTGGTTYFIAVDGKNGATGNLVLAWRLSPSNDNFADAQIISGASGQVGSQVPANYNPATGHYYAAVTVPSPGVNWAQASAAAQSMQFAGVSGHLATITSAPEMQFIIDHFPNALAGGFWLGGYQDQQAPDYREPDGGWRWVTGEPWQYTNWNSGEPNNVGNIEDKLQVGRNGVWNDLYAGNQILGYLVEFEGNVTTPTPLVTNTGATREPAEPIHANNGGASVWFRWTAPQTGSAVFSTLGSSFDTLLGVYSGSSVGALTSIAANDNDPAGGIGTSKVTFNVTAGAIYSIAVDGLGAQTGNIIMNWSIAPAPPNDNFVNARGITGLYGMLTGTNLSATREPGEPDHAGKPGGTSVWYLWTAPSSGSITFTTLGGDFDTLLAVYTGSAVNALTPIASNDDDPSIGKTSKVTFDAVGGSAYFIAVDGYRGATGNLTLTWSPRPSYWQAADIVIGTDLSARLLWGNLVGRSVLWSVNNQGRYSFGPYYGPSSGFTASHIAAGGDTLTRVLWNNVDGSVALWLMDARNTFLRGINFGPYPGWTAVDLTVGSDNQARILWTNTDGQAAIWTVDNSGNATPGPVYGPYDGWTARAIAAEADGLTRVLWNNTDGSMGLWLVGLDNTYQASFGYGPFPGWTAIDIAVGIDGQARVLWSSMDGRMALWSVDNSGNILDQAGYGPYPGWTPQSVAAGVDGLTWVLWNNANGAAGLWLLSNKNNYESSFGYGPY